MKALREWFESFGWSLWRLWHYTLHPRAIWRKVVKYHQRGVRGWAQEDTWSFDYYLTQVIVGGLLDLRENSNGYPAMLEPDPVLDALGGRCIPDEPDPRMEQWREILLDIVRGFAADSLLRDSVIYTIENDKLYRDHELEAKLLATREKGFNLFKEYYGALWD